MTETSLPPRAHAPCRAAHDGRGRRRARQGARQAILDEEARVIVEDARGQQAFRIRRRRGHHDFHSGDVGEPCLEHVRMLSGRAGARAGTSANGDRHSGLSAGHEAQLRRMIDDLIHRDGDEVHQHDLRDRPHAGERRAHGRADDGLFGDRRGAHAMLAILRREPLGHLEYAAALAVADVLAEEHHARIARQRLIQAPCDRHP